MFGRGPMKETSLADRVDRRVRHLGEVLLEVGVEDLGLVRQRRDRRVGAHGADRLLAGDGHGRHEDLQILLSVAEGLLAIEQRLVRDDGGDRDGRHVLEHDLGALQPVLVGMGLGEALLDLVVGDDAAGLEVDQEHAAGLQPPLGDDPLLRDRQDAGLRRHDDEAVVGDEVARGPEAVAVEGGADPAAVGEGDGGRPVPGLHQGGVVLVEGAPVLVHERVARPGLGDQHHRGVRELVAALDEELEGVVEAGGVGLALVGDRPELLDVLAEQRALDGGLAGRHPVDVAAQRVDLAVVGDHPVRMGELPRREGVGREALVD
jgi:hypothetical protein